MPAVPFDPVKLKSLRKPAIAREFLQLSLSQKGADGFLKALGEVLKAHGRHSEAVSVRPEANPGFETVARLLDSLGLELSLQEKRAE